jgi:CxxC motif-containing protein
MISLICIVCPGGCHLLVDPENSIVKGNKCEQGIGYGLSETRNPVRTVTSTVRFASESHPRLPVKTDRPISKKDIFAVMAALDAIDIIPPVRIGEILVENIAGTGANLVATRSLGK